jgi:hypothetical protein
LLDIAKRSIQGNTTSMIRGGSASAKNFQTVTPAKLAARRLIGA